MLLAVATKLVPSSFVVTEMKAIVSTSLYVRGSLTHVTSEHRIVVQGAVRNCWSIKENIIRLISLAFSYFLVDSEVNQASNWNVSFSWFK